MVLLLIRQGTPQNHGWAEGGVMSWKRERDALIAQTLAFVQSVTGKREEPSKSPVEPRQARPEPEIKTRPPVQSKPNPAIAETAKSLEPPHSMAPRAPLPRPIVPSEMAREIRERIASFRAHQERFNREREEYFAATLARLRAAIKDAPPPPRL